MSDQNPVKLMDSVNAMDLLYYAHHRLKPHAQTVGDRKRLAEIKEQELRHKFALRKYIEGDRSKLDEFEPVEKELTPAPEVPTIPKRRSKTK